MASAFLDYNPRVRGGGWLLQCETVFSASSILFHLLCGQLTEHRHHPMSVIDGPGCRQSARDLFDRPLVGLGARSMLVLMRPFFSVQVVMGTTWITDSLSLKTLLVTTRKVVSDFFFFFFFKKKRSFSSLVRLAHLTLLPSDECDRRVGSADSRRETFSTGRWLDWVPDRCWF